MVEVSKEEISSILSIARSDSIKALSMFRECNNEFCYEPNVIKKVIGFIKEDSLNEVLTIINNLQDEWTKGIALSNLALHSQSYNLDIALKIANLCDSYDKPRVLEKIVSEVLKRDIETAKKIANSIDKKASKTGALASIASYTHDEETIDQLIETTKMSECWDYCDVLTNIAYRIAGNFPDKAIELLNEICCNKSDAIELVAWNLSDTTLAINLIKTSIKDDEVPWLSMALGAMAIRLTKTDMKKALTLVDEIQDEDEKENALFWIQEETKLDKLDTPFI
ncbi:hypothetical protein B0F89_1533 [Malaciobacter marinus]|jgi:hypothetical protein|uniref:HEAT repeat domain-containing protein n=1 Tax=Malaciobacter marinus TaxID=505249 RepID=A0AB36ZUC7_9BACT|nr:hypothetical protein [Malaciobacter marinus]PPK57184.1 hypothetical protein B0F89_1533 [Malaciobacter marinus]